jgi:hypothetical protein
MCNSLRLRIFNELLDLMKEIGIRENQLNLDEQQGNANGALGEMAKGTHQDIEGVVTA